MWLVQECSFLAHLKVSVNSVYADEEGLLKESKLPVHLHEPVNEHSSVPGVHLGLVVHESFPDGVARILLKCKQVIVDVPHILPTHVWVISVLCIHIRDACWNSIGCWWHHPHCLPSLVSSTSLVSVRCLLVICSCQSLHHFWSNFPVVSTYIIFIRGNLGLVHPTVDWNS